MNLKHVMFTALVGGFLGITYSDRSGFLDKYKYK